jgi:hypothetical protein
MAKKLGYGQKATAIMELLNADPTATDKAIARRLGCNSNYVYSLRKKMAHRAAEETPQAKVKEAFPDFAHMLSQGKERNVDAILDERASSYGSFMDLSRIAQRLKNTAHQFCSDNEKRFDVDQAEALDMIFSKLARILNGDPNHADSWIDIAGYAKLVSDRLEGKSR